MRAVRIAAAVIAWSSICAPYPFISQPMPSRVHGDVSFVSCYNASSVATTNTVRSKKTLSPDHAAHTYTETVASYANGVCSNTSRLYVRRDGERKYRPVFQRLGTSGALGNGIRVVAWSKTGKYLLFEVWTWQYGSDAPAEKELWVYNSGTNACSELHVAEVREGFGRGCLVDVVPVRFVSDEVISLRISAKQYHEPEGDMRKPECLRTHRKDLWYYDLIVLYQDISHSLVERKNSSLRWKGVFPPRLRCGRS